MFLPLAPEGLTFAKPRGEPLCSVQSIFLLYPTFCSFPSSPSYPPPFWGVPCRWDEGEVVLLGQRTQNRAPGPCPLGRATWVTKLQMWLLLVGRIKSSLGLWRERRAKPGTCPQGADSSGWEKCQVQVHRGALHSEGAPE